MTRPDLPQPDDEGPVRPEPDPTESDHAGSDERQSVPDHDLEQDDELRSGQYGPGD